MSKPSRPAKTKTPEPIALSESEIAVMMPYLNQAAAAVQSYKSAQAALDSITRTIAGRAGSMATRYDLDLQNKRLIPIR